MPDKVIIIAEIGECYNGDLKIAEKLIKIAKRSGCDIVKFQTLDYENISDCDVEAQWFRKIALSPEKIRRLIRSARNAKIAILFSPENVKTARWLLEAGLQDVKIASNTIIDADFINFVNNNFHTVYVSTGMSSLDEVKKAVKNLSSVADLYIMHCISEYPTGPLLEKRGLVALSQKEVRLNMMKMLMELFPEHRVGYSDHTSGIFVPVIAAAAGARVIEKHITLDRQTPIRNFNTGGEYLGTDHILSIEADELKEMVRQIRQVEIISGAWKWERSKGEKILKDFLRGRFACK